MKLHRTTANQRGHDYVVGDLHGERAWLERELHQIGFEPARDRLFAVGDLIDRGEDSLATLHLLEEPWFHAVLGNHEAMMIAAEDDENARFDWLRHGGEWASVLSARVLARWVDRLRALPHLIVVGDQLDRFQLVHAELTDTLGMPLTDHDLDGPGRFHCLREQRMLWSTSMARRYSRHLGASAPMHGQMVHPGLSPTFCGHCPVNEPGWYLSHYFLDGGAGYGSRLENGSAPRLHVRQVAPLLQSFLLARAHANASAGCALLLPPLQQAASGSSPQHD